MDRIHKNERIGELSNDSTKRLQAFENHNKEEEVHNKEEEVYAPHRYIRIRKSIDDFTLYIIHTPGLMGLPVVETTSWDLALA
tara:strand:+ start:207 stop:455 length:249 start_codon:yes stop_codon:yes gene_type:complete